MDKLLERLVNDGIPEARDSVEEALLLAVAGAISAFTQMAKAMQIQADALCRIADAMQPDAMEDEAGTVGWGGLDG